MRNKEIDPEKAAKLKERMEKRLEYLRKRQEKEAKRAEREEKRNAAKNLIAKASGVNRISKPEFNFTQTNEIKSIINDVLEARVFHQAKLAQQPDFINADGKIYRKFTCDELIKIFGGWFTLKYLFSIQSETEKSPLTGKPIETDFYVCSKDITGVEKYNRPPLNEALHKQFGVDVYGFCIIAPSTVF